MDSRGVAGTRLPGAPPSPAAAAGPDSGGAPASAAGSASGGAKPRKKVDAKMAASKRKAREAVARGKTGGALGRFIPTLVALLAAAGVSAYRGLKPAFKPISEGEVTAPRIVLPDGRHLAVHEAGAGAGDARYHVVVLHDLRGCRISMLPNVSQEYLVAHGVRLVSYDRPGYGQSDAHPARTAASDAQDVTFVAEQLKLGEKFFVVSLGPASYVGWELLRSAPERLAGVALVSPWWSLFSTGLSEEELLQAWQAMPRSERVQYWAALAGPWGVSAWRAAARVLGPTTNRGLPGWLTLSALPAWAAGRLPASAEKMLKSALASLGVLYIPGHAPSPEDLGSEDLAVLNSGPVRTYFNSTESEALRQGVGESVFRDLALVARSVGVEAEGLGLTPAAAASGGKPRLSPPRVHVWFGRADHVVPPVVHKHAQRVVPSVHLHEVPDAGHYLLFQSERRPREILSDLLGLEEAATEFAPGEGEAATAKLA